MGMAFKGAGHNPGYRAKFNITEFAVDKYRNFVEHEHKSSSVQELARLLDERISDALQSGRLTDVIDSDQPTAATKIALVENRNREKCYVVLRPSEYKTGASKLVLSPEVAGGFLTITVLSETTGGQNIINQTWKVVNRPFAGKLELVTPATKPTETEPEPDTNVGRVRKWIIENNMKTFTASDIAKALGWEQMRAINTLASMSNRYQIAHDGKPQGVRTYHVNASAITSERTAPRKIPPGAMSRESIEERVRFARGILQQRPHITIRGKDGIDVIMRQRFDISLSDRVVESLRNEVLTGAPAVIELPAPATVKPKAAQAPAPAPTPKIDASTDMAVRLTTALAKEKTAHERVKVVEEALAVAVREAGAAKLEVDEIMSRMQELRG